MRFLLASAAGLCAFAFAGTALAAYTPRLTITGASQNAGAPGGIKVKFQAGQTDDPTAKATFYVPLGYQLGIPGTAGTQLGTAAASVFAIDLNALVPVTGTVAVANPADFAAQATACTGTASHTSTWALNLSAAGTPLVVPVFVDTVTAGPLALFASATLVICLPPPDLPPGTPGRATLGAKLLTAEFTTSAITNPAALGEYRWRATATPYTPAKGTVNAAATVEVQSLVDLPTKLSLKATVKKTSKKGISLVSYTGTGLSNGQGLSTASVDLLKGSSATVVKKFKTQSTDANGAFSGSFAQRQAKTATKVYILARVTTQDRDLGPSGCTATFVPPASPFSIPCLDATVGGVTVSSTIVKASIPAAPKPKPRKKGH